MAEPTGSMLEIAKAIAREKGFDPTDAELQALIEEQFAAPASRAITRYNRKADEMLCQKLENDERFKGAIEVERATRARPN